MGGACQLTTYAASTSGRSVQHGPDLVILLETDDATLKRRMTERELDRIEQAGSDFHRRVREGFTEMAAADPTRWYVIDASTPADETAATIRKVVSERLGI